MSWSVDLAGTRMIARSEEEFQLFQRMDGKRITRESIDEALRHSSRLMYEDELSEYLLRDTAGLVELSDDSEDEQSKGRRAKYKVDARLCQRKNG